MLLEDHTFRFLLEDSRAAKSTIQTTVAAVIFSMGMPTMHNTSNQLRPGAAMLRNTSERSIGKEAAPENWMESRHGSCFTLYPTMFDVLHSRTKAEMRTVGANSCNRPPFHYS